MTYIEYSAFDPLFMLHHAMIDRCFAMWQVLNPNSYVEPGTTLMPTYTDRLGQRQDIDSPLTPFHRTSAGLFWTSRDVRNTQVFNYVYPETSGSSTEAIRQQVISSVSTLYGSTRTTNGRVSKRMVDMARQASENHEWIANIVVAKHALAQTFFIHVFLGDFDRGQPTSWNRAANLVGTHAVFTRAPPPPSDALQAIDASLPEHLISATIPLTEKLAMHVDQGLLASLDPADVQPYLERNLRYRVSIADGTSAANTQVRGLRVSVVSSLVKRGNATLPKWGPMQNRIVVTTD